MKSTIKSCINKNCNNKLSTHWPLDQFKSKYLFSNLPCLFILIEQNVSFWSRVQLINKNTQITTKVRESNVRRATLVFKHDGGRTEVWRDTLCFCWEMPIYGLESTTKMGVLKEILHTIGETKILNMYVLGLEKKELYCMYYT